MSLVSPFGAAAVGRVYPTPWDRPVTNKEWRHGSKIAHLGQQVGRGYLPAIGVSPIGGDVTPPTVCHPDLNHAGMDYTSSEFPDTT